MLPSHKEIFKWMLSLILLMVSSVACNLPGFNPTPENSSVPLVAVSSLTADQTLTVNQEVQVESVSIDPQEGVVRVELVVNGQVVWIDANAQPQANTPFIVAQPWVPKTVGSHTVQVKAYNQNNSAGESQPLTVTVVTTAATTEGETLSPDEDTVAALDSANTATPMPQATQPVHTPVPAAATLTPTPAGPLPTPTVTSTPTVTPAPQKFKATGIEPEGRFKDIWLELGAGDSRLGHPMALEVADRDYARQRFEKGVMFWWDNPSAPDYIWVVDSPAEDMQSGSTSNLYPDTWDDDSDEYSCEAAKDNGPVRGFGKVWCQHTELHSRIGFPIESERGSGGNPPHARVQFFQGGVMVYVPLGNEVFVLFAQGDWQRFDY